MGGEILKEMVKDELGEEFLFPPPFNIKETFENASNTSLIIFLLTPGSDPITPVVRYVFTRSLFGGRSSNQCASSDAQRSINVYNIKFNPLLIVQCMRDSIMKPQILI